jgi:pilus assembly protein Flp/PilA
MSKNMDNAFKQFLGDESAVTAIEYALLGALIAVVIVVSVTTVGTQLSRLYNFVKDQVVLATK